MFVYEKILYGVANAFNSLKTKLTYWSVQGPDATLDAQLVGVTQDGNKRYELHVGLSRT